MKQSLLIATVLLAPGFARAGLYYSGENVAELPSQWRGFLLDQRSLRALSVKPQPGLPPSPLLADYRDALAKLENKANPTPDDLADLGALYIRVGQPAKAIDVLRTAQRKHPKHFAIAANLGTAWQLSGDLEQAAVALRQAIALAPEKLKPVEELHLKLVQARRVQKNNQQLDDLLGVPLDKLTADDRKKLPPDAVAHMQRLALALPTDGRLLWQLGELANAYGDVRTAAAIFDGCVTEFGMTTAEFRARRQTMRTAADKLGPAVRTDNAPHETHGLTFRSPRPLPRRFDAAHLPPPRETGPTPLPWTVLAETSLDARGHAKFLDYLKKLDGKTVSITGFMQPISDAFDVASFLLVEYPIGCWFCELPPPTALIMIDLPNGKSVSIRRGLIKVEGKLKLNAADPEDFLYTLQDAVVGEVD